jgi:hypothetical protein
MSNLFNALDVRYRFLRQQAEKAYATPVPPPRVHKSGTQTWTEHDHFRPEREGSALGTAAVDAYFSTQEHFFCLAAAFLPAGPPADMLAFLRSNWRAKARAILFSVGDDTLKDFYAKLVAIRDEWRNPLAHGGFLSGGDSLFFHLPGVGALPARLRRTPKGLKAGFSLYGASFEEITTLFDAFDSYLTISVLRYPFRWAQSGLSVPFDAKSIKEFSKAMHSDSDFESFLEYAIYRHDMHANMDY